MIHKYLADSDVYALKKEDEIRTDYSYPQDAVKNFFDKYKKDFLKKEYRNNKMFTFSSVNNAVERFKNGKIVRKIKDFFEFFIIM